MLEEASRSLVQTKLSSCLKGMWKECCFSAFRYPSVGGDYSSASEFEILCIQNEETLHRVSVIVLHFLFQIWKIQHMKTWLYSGRISLKKISLLPLEEKVGVKIVSWKTIADFGFGRVAGILWDLVCAPIYILVN